MHVVVCVSCVYKAGTVDMSWFLKRQVFELPEDVGIPIGGADSNTLYRLEIHYNNPTNIAGKYSIYLSQIWHGSLKGHCRTYGPIFIIKVVFPI